MQQQSILKSVGLNFWNYLIEKLIYIYKFYIYINVNNKYSKKINNLEKNKNQQKISYLILSTQKKPESF